MDIPRKPTNKRRRRWLLASAGIAVVLLLTVALSRLEPAAPTVDRNTVWTDTVERGTMLRQVRGPGTLTAEETRWIPAVTPGRIEAKRVQPGTVVTPETVILDLSNPDVERQALEAERQLASARAELTNLRATLENQRLNQEATVATTRSQLREARRQMQAQEGLAAQNMAAPMELARVRDQAAEMEERLAIEQKRLRFQEQSVKAQLAAQQSQIQMLSTLAAFQRRQVESMQVRAGAAGVLQEMPVEVGQWVTSGATLAKVVQPGRLKAVLRIPETQAKDVVIGQAASVDTRNGVVRGRVVRIDPAVQNGTVTVDLALEGPLPKGARPDLSVDGTIDIERLDDVLYLGRPAYGQPESTVGLFRLGPDDTEATRINVQLGRGSASTIEVRQGLKPGDVVILSDMSAWDTAERVRLK